MLIDIDKYEHDHFSKDLRQMDTNTIYIGRRCCTEGCINFNCNVAYKEDADLAGCGDLW